MGQADYLVLGEWNAQCWQCGGKFKAGQLQRHWQGYMVCPRCWEPRQPQDFVKAPPDQQAPPWTQPKADVFIPVCSPNDQSDVVGFGVVGCMTVGFVSPYFDPSVGDPL
jgi:hypothetical protein